MFPGGLYPALITPFDHGGKVDGAALARLLAWQESQGSAGVVLAGSNGEGASLSALERRDLARTARLAKGSLKIVLGLPTSSLEDAAWGARQAAKDGADAILASPPFFFRRAKEAGIRQWLLDLMEASPLPVILYHNPAVFGAPLPLDSFEELASHPRCLGVKNSASDPSLFAWFKSRLNDEQLLFVGDETLLREAMEAGASGSISGAANILPAWLSAVIRLWPSPEAEAKLDLILPVLKAARSCHQPETYKAVLARWGLIDSPSPRLPLEAVDAKELAALVESTAGRQFAPERRGC